MFVRAVVLATATALLLACSSQSTCYEPTPAFPVPTWAKRENTPLQSGFRTIEDRLQSIISRPKYNATSYSIQVTSAEETLWSASRTALVQNCSRPGDRHVSEFSQFRIASISKVFTVLAILQQHQAGNLHLDDPVLAYIPELQDPSHRLPWVDISLRALASQLSGIPREFAQSDLINSLPDPSSLGLPPMPRDGLPTCDEYVSYARACNRTDFFDRLAHLQPMFAPNQKSSYSNVNYELLGLVVENVTGTSFKDYVQKAIFDPLNMTRSSIDKPSDECAVLPILRNGNHYWDVETGVQTPTGGIYSCSSDLSVFLRYILTHYNSVATGVNWLLPSSWTASLDTFYGMPFEIFRTNSILEESYRPVTFVTKSGGLPGYTSRITLMEEYGLGLTILVGGEGELLGELQNAITTELVNAAERTVWEDMEAFYCSSYISNDETLNSSLVLSTSPSKGLHLTSFVSNGTDVLHAVLPGQTGQEGDNEKGGGDIRASRRSWNAQLVPTLLFKNETSQQGEIWRVVVVQKRPAHSVKDKPWDSFCITNDDPTLYAGKPVNEIVFWHERGTIELPAWNLTLYATERQGRSGLFVQSDTGRTTR